MATFNTYAQIRAACGMGASVPTDAVLLHWQTLADAIITAYKSDPDNDVAAGIELNRVAAVYNQTRKLTGTSENWKTGTSVIIKPLTKGEKESLSNDQRSVWWF